MGLGIYFNLPAYGHINPTLPLVQELVRRGEHIAYYTSADFKGLVERNGAEARGFTQKISGVNNDIMTGGNFLKLADTLLGVTEQIIPMVLDDLEGQKPDYIIHDSICPWGKYIAALLGVRAINTTPTFVFTHEAQNHSGSLRSELFKRVREIGLKKKLAISKRQKALDHQCGIKTDMIDLFQNLEDLNLVFTSRYFQPGGEKLDERFQFIGPSIADRKDAQDYSFEKFGEQPLIYISLGTIARDKMPFFQACIRALADTDYAVLISIGSQFKKEDFGELPGNIFLENYAPQLEVLKHARLFISHGGMNSVNESLYFGVPLILFPQQSEQAMVADRVQELGAGLAMAEENIPQHLADTVRSMLADQEYYDRAALISRSFHASGGYQHGVDLILG